MAEPIRGLVSLRRLRRDTLVVAAASVGVIALLVTLRVGERVVGWAGAAGRLRGDLLVLLVVVPVALLVFTLLEIRRLRAEIARRKEVEAQLAWHAEHDPLTGLGNRRSIDAALKAASESMGAGTALLFLDLDGFKEINDAFGHTVGDEVLAITAARLRGVVRPQDTVARYGGDEFLIVAHDVDMPTATGLAHRAGDALAAPFVVAGRELLLTTSIGVAHGNAGEDTGELLARADAAMYRTKRAVDPVIREAG